MNIHQINVRIKSCTNKNNVRKKQILFCMFDEENYDQIILIHNDGKRKKKITQLKKGKFIFFRIHRQTDTHINIYSHFCHHSPFYLNFGSLQLSSS